MGVEQVPVLPGGRWKLGVGQLPGGQHDLAVLTVDHVPVLVHAGEIVVGPDLLELLVRTPERTLVLDLEVVDGRDVVLYVPCRQVFLDLEGHLVNLFQAVCLQRIIDTVLDVRRLPVVLVGRHHEILDESGIHRTDDQGRDDHAADGNERQVAALRAERHQEQPCAANGHEEHDPQRVHPGMQIGVPRAEGESRFGKQQAVHVEPVAPCHEQEDDGAQDADVVAGVRPDLYAALFDGDGAPVEIVEGHRDGRGHDEEQQPEPDEMPDRQREDEEPDIDIEYGIGGTEGLLVEEPEHAVPVGQADQAHDGSNDQDADDRHDLDQPGVGEKLFEFRHFLVEQVQFGEARGEVPRQVDIRPEAHQRDQSEDQSREELGADRRPEHVVEAQLAEPERLDEDVGPESAEDPQTDYGCGRYEE